MPQPIRYAILGFGLHAVRRLIPAFAPVRHCALHGMWRRNQTLAAENVKQFGIAHSFATPEELCASDEVDAVFIVSPDALHLEHVLLAFKHGKPVLCEKPLSMNAAQASEMLDAAAVAGVPFGVAQNFRFNRSLELIRDWIAAGKIGKPALAHVEYTYPAQLSPRTWITDPSLACGGPIADVGVHCIDALRFVLDNEVTSISTLARKASPQAQVESFASLQIEMTGGVFASVTVGGSAPYRTVLEVTGEDGVIIAENGLTVDRPLNVTLRRGGELIETVQVSNSDAYTRMLDCFALTVRGEAEFPATGADALKNMRALDAAYRSWHSGQREQV